MQVLLVMELPDSVLFQNCDLDLVYLASIFDIEFTEYLDLWASNMEDSELLEVVNHVESYFPIVEDISLDDSELCSAVEAIQSQ